MLPRFLENLGTTALKYLRLIYLTQSLDLSGIFVDLWLLTVSAIFRHPKYFEALQMQRFFVTIKKVALNKLLQVKILALLVDNAFYLMFKYKNVLVLSECRLSRPEEGGRKLLRNVGDYRSTYQGFLADFGLHHTAVRISNPAQPRALRRQAITSFDAADPWQVSDPRASRSGQFIPDKRFPSKHISMTSIKFVLASQARFIN